MYSDKRHFLIVLIMLFALASCGEMADDLFPSGTDKRPSVDTDTTGSGVGQIAPDFSVSDTNGTTVTLASALSGRTGIVLYFTMWCPICDSHMSNMMNDVIPLFPDVGFFAVDYVSGTIADARNAQVSNGYASLSVLADIDHILLQGYEGTMGTTVVIDSTGTIMMNEDYRDGTDLQAVLSGLP